ncbi:MAG: HAD family phosphatase [Anaerolineae bacterium]
MSSEPLYHAILFDMDGVIIDTRAPIMAFWNELAAAHGITLTAQDFERDIHGCLPTRTLDRFFPHLAPAEQAAALEHLDVVERNQSYRAIPGALALLAALKARSIPTALVTSANQSKVGAVSGQLRLDGLFTIYVTSEEITHGKPAPDAYLRAAQRLNKSPLNCVVFEDAVSGVQAATAAGTRCIGVQSPEFAPALLAAGAAHVIPDFKEVRLKTDCAGAFVCLELGSGVESKLLFG